MEIDESEESTKKAEELQNLVSKRLLQSSIAKLSGSSRGIPFEKDFHFYNNFPEFKSPIQQADENSRENLEKIGVASGLWGKGKGAEFPGDSEDLDLEPYDWLVNFNDDIMERFDASVDEFREVRKQVEEGGVRMASGAGEDGEGGFEMVYGKKKNKKGVVSGVGSSVGKNENASGLKVQVAAKSKAKVPFHIPSIPRPQDEYKIIVNNANQPFEHVWLQRSEDGSRLIHPAEQFSPLDFVDKNVYNIEPVKPPPLASTPFKFVEQVKDLKVLAGKLRNVDEFAVDLEHNQYRSFQGLTCLMQISTRDEDFVVDTLKLRIHIGPYLREVFKDPTKKKVMHGSERDIMWLQRDFGIYVCNMFDTGQASRVLNLERNSLEYLLQLFCGVTANKEYQNAEWRLRPLPEEMVRYAREDTHYLLYIFDEMKIRLLSMIPESEHSDPPLVEVYKRSYDICLQLYEKELLTDDSYLYIYGVQGADLTAEQLAVVAGLCEWRDVVARAEDESTGYILPNKTLIELAKQMPLTANKLQRLVKSKHPYVERNLSSVVSIIRHSLQNAANFKDVVERLRDLKEQRALKEFEDISAMVEGSEVLPSESPEKWETSVDAGFKSSSSPKLTSTVQGNMLSDTGCSLAGDGRKQKEECLGKPAENGDVNSGVNGSVAASSKQNMTTSEPSGETNSNLGSPSSRGATVQVLKKPTRAFGALLGSSAKRKFPPDKREPEQIKLEEIKSTVHLPFHAFVSKGEETATEEPVKPHESSPWEGPVAEDPSETSPREEPTPTSSSRAQDIIILDSDDEPANKDPVADATEDTSPKDDGNSSPMVTDDGDEPESLSDLSSSFQKCLDSVNEKKKTSSSTKSREPEGLLQLKPFDYEAARKQVKFGKSAGGGGMDDDGKDDEDQRGSRHGKGPRKSGSGLSQPLNNEGAKDLLPQGKRRQAFPASGNRSASFR